MYIVVNYIDIEIEIGIAKSMAQVASQGDPLRVCVYMPLSSASVPFPNSRRPWNRYDHLSLTPSLSFP